MKITIELDDNILKKFELAVILAEEEFGQVVEKLFAQYSRDCFTKSRR